MPDWVYQLITPAAAAAGVYAAIRADLARLHERATHALESAREALARIDHFYFERMTMTKRKTPPRGKNGRFKKKR